MTAPKTPTPLKPCPFCPGDLESLGNAVWHKHRDGFLCPLGNTGIEIGQWNTRPALPPQLDEAIEEIRRLIQSKGTITQCAAFGVMLAYARPAPVGGVEGLPAGIRDDVRYFLEGEYEGAQGESVHPGRRLAEYLSRLSPEPGL